jgi:hypothetical protein
MTILTPWLFGIMFYSKTQTMLLADNAFDNLLACPPQMSICIRTFITVTTKTIRRPAYQCEHLEQVDRTDYQGDNVAQRNAPESLAFLPEQFQPVGVWQSLRDDGKAQSCSTGKVAKNETTVIQTQSPTVRLHWCGRRGSCSAAAATNRPISVQQRTPTTQASWAKEADTHQQLRSRRWLFHRGAQWPRKGHLPCKKACPIKCCRVTNGFRPIRGGAATIW